jgi:two-component system osmolarity sensor histidine kinase EnvZ
MAFDWKLLDPWRWVRKILPRTLFARSLLIIVVPVLILQVVAMMVFVDNHWRKVTGRMAFAVAGEIATMVQMIENAEPGRKEQQLGNMATYAASNLDLLITFEPSEKLMPGAEISGTWETFTAEALSEALRKQVRRPFSLSFSSKDDWANIGIQMDDGILRVLVLDRRIFSSSAYIFLLWLVGSSVILFAIAAVFMRNQVRPIRKLAIAAERVGMGRDIPASFKPEGAREVRQAARAFLDMHERITRQMEQRTTMLAGISHDLRTPLTRLKLGLSLLGEGEDVVALKGDVEDMERMIGSYLDFVRGDGEEVSQRLNIAEIAEKIASRARYHGKLVDLSVSGETHAFIRPLAFERCLQNLVSNAERYGKHVWISVAKEKEKDQIEIRVEDDGPGLEPTLYEDVFKPFFRADSSRNPETGGVGLGLPIVRDIVHAHGGKIHLEKSLHGGLCVVISLPTS